MRDGAGVLNHVYSITYVIISDSRASLCGGICSTAQRVSGYIIKRNASARESAYMARARACMPNYWAILRTRAGIGRV